MFVSEFFHKELNSLKFYEDLNHQFIEDDLGWLKQRSFNYKNLFDVETIDYLSYLLLVNAIQQLKLDREELNALAKSYSKRYFELIDTDNLNLKLRCQRLNYLLQLYLDRNITSCEPATLLDGNIYYYPWDIELIEGNLIVVESKDVVKFNNIAVARLSSANLMLTQVDQFEDKVIFNSCYTSYVVDADSKIDQMSITEYNRSLFVFYYKKKQTQVTLSGEVMCGEHKIGTLGEFKNAWRFRILSNFLFVFDWFQFGSCIIFDLDTGFSRRHSFLEMYIPHDVTMVDNRYYFLDKQQGMIFIYDLNFTFISNKLSFGYKPSQLCDPIGIKKMDNKLVVSSWLSGKINVVNV